MDTGGGLAWIDIDNDGFYDLYVPNPIANASSRLYHNVDAGDGTRTFSDITGFPSLFAHNFAYASTGVVAADFDGDGCDDLFVTNGGSSASGQPVPEGSQHNTMLLNTYCNSGTTAFFDVTDYAGLSNDTLNSMVASAGDIDGDGDLDLYVGNYLTDGQIAPGTQASCDPNNLYLNDGQGVFTEVGAQLGVDDVGCTLGTVLSDFDGDGDLDIYVTNDFTNPDIGTTFVDVPDTFYRNEGVDSNGMLKSFVRDTTTNLQDSHNGMGIAAGDYNNDGLQDYYTTSFSAPLPSLTQNVLHENTGLGHFIQRADSAGVADRLSTPQGERSIGWGAVFFDADNDGWLDLYKATGLIQETNFPAFSLMQPASQANRLYMNNQDGTFREIGAQANIVGKYNFDFEPVPGSGIVATAVLDDPSRGASGADYDNDGDVDLFVANSGQLFNNLFGTRFEMPHRLYRNDTVNTNQWLQVRLVGAATNHRGIGAKLQVTSTSAAGTMTQTREIIAGSSHGSTNAYPVHFGFPAGSQIDQLTVNWPDGASQTLTNVSLDRVVTVTKSTGFTLMGRVTVLTAM